MSCLIRCVGTGEKEALDINNMEKEIKNLIKDALQNLSIEVSDITLEHPEDFKNGDYSSNIALTIARGVKENPKILADKIVTEMLRLNTDKRIEKVEVAGAGFINFYLSRSFFAESVEEILNKAGDFGRNDLLKGKKIMIEYTQPNPFKPFHIGHLMSNAIGESLSRLVAFANAEIYRTNYQGDVGLHVAKAIYGLFKNSNLQNRSGDHNLEASNIGEAYIYGAKLYEEDEKVKKEIDEINKKIYTREDKTINDIYAWGFRVTMDAFEDIYKMLGTRFDLYFLESQMSDIGRGIVNDNPGGIFEESDGAIVFKAEKFDPKLHTRVFITKSGLPTYETKELGLTEEKFKTKPDMDLSIVVTANEQKEYMRVVKKAIALIHPEYEKKMKHITHGMMRLASGKMGSRKGNAITGESLIRDVKKVVSEKMQDRDFSKEEKEKVISDIAVSAIKYSILKQSTEGDIIYDFEKSISFEGDSGPYLQYSYARANSVLEKSQKENILPDFEHIPDSFYEIEQLLYRFPEVVKRAVEEYEPHYISTYLIESARTFNSFYGNNVIVDKGDKFSSYKIALTHAFVFVMKNGLYLLGIEAPKKM